MIILRYGSPIPDFVGLEDDKVFLIAESAPSRLERAVPVEEIHPAVVEVVRREQSSVLVQIIDRGAIGFLVRVHLGLPGHPSALAQIARGAGRDNIFP